MKKAYDRCAKLCGVCLGISVAVGGGEEPRVVAKDYLVKKPKTVEWATLEAATDSKLRVVTLEAVPGLQQLTGVYGVAPNPIRSGGGTGISGRAQDGMMITVAVSESLVVMPVSVMGRLGDRVTVMGGDEIEALTRADITQEKVRGGMLAGTGSTKLGVGIYRGKQGRGYSGDQGFVKVIPHREADFYDLQGPYEVAKLPFRILLRTEEENKDGGVIQAAMVWFPSSFEIQAERGSCL